MSDCIDSNNLSNLNLRLPPSTELLVMDVDSPLVKSALLIGPTYGHLKPELQLQGTLNDVALIKEVISEPPFSFTSIKELTHITATHSNILESLAEIAHNAPADSVVLIYFSGHGSSVKGQEHGHYDEGLVPVDATHENIEKMCITGDAFADPLRKLMEKNVATTLIFDCCFSGHMYRGETLINDPEFKITAVKQVIFTGKRAEPVEHDDFSPSHDDPAQLIWNLPYPIQETWNKKCETEGWRPADKDKFIFLAACNSHEKAFEIKEERTKKCYGFFTYCLANVLSDVAGEKIEISYEVFFSLLRQQVLEKRVIQSPQTPQPPPAPQIEGGEFGTLLFDVKKVKLRADSVKVIEVLKNEPVLGGGKLQLLVDGVYDVFEAGVTADQLVGKNGDTCPQWMGSIEVRRSNIGMTTSKGDITKQIRDIKPGCVAKLSKRGSMGRENVVLGPHETADKMRVMIEETQMFHISKEKERDNDCILTVTKLDNGKEAWCAHRHGRLILPLVYLGQEDIMAQNLVKDARYRMTRNLSLSNSRELQKVEIKIVKIKRINKQQLSTPNLKQQNMSLVLRTEEDLFKDALLRNDRPTVVAHKTCEMKMHGNIKKLGLVESSGDALVVRIVNHESFPIHICLLFLQLDGGIVVQYPRKKGSTIELKPKESVEELIRMYIPTDSMRRYCEPDVNKPEPDRAVDSLMLLASTEECDFGPLLQTEVAFGGPMSELRNTEAHHIADLNPLEQFQKALCCRNGEYLDGSTDRKWLVLKREFWLVKSHYS